MFISIPEPHPQCSSGFRSPPPEGVVRFVRGTRDSSAPPPPPTQGFARFFRISQDPGRVLRVPEHPPHPGFRTAMRAVAWRPAQHLTSYPIPNRTGSNFMKTRPQKSSSQSAHTLKSSQIVPAQLRTSPLGDRRRAPSTPTPFSPILDNLFSDERDIVCLLGEPRQPSVHLPPKSEKVPSRTVAEVAIAEAYLPEPVIHPIREFTQTHKKGHPDAHS